MACTEAPPARRRKRPSAFWAGFWEGLAAPTLLFSFSREEPYESARKRIEQSWQEVGRHMWWAVGEVDPSAESRHGRR
jgi:hypothetical protein